MSSRRSGDYIVMEEDGMAHKFSRDRTAAHCYVCQGMWPENNAVITKYYSCSTCGLSCHAGCRYMALRCYQCQNKTDHKKLEVADLNALPTKGRIYCVLLQAYDLAIPTGRSIYGISKLSGSKEVIKTLPIVVYDGECAWTSSEEKLSLGTEDLSSSNSSSRHRPPPLGTQQEEVEEDSLEWAPSKFFTGGAFAEAARYVINVELWNSSFYGVFDTLVTDFEINLIPILLHPNVAVERWFPVGNIKECPVGMMLVRLVFAEISPELNLGQLLSTNAEPANAKQTSNNKAIRVTDNIDVSILSRVCSKDNDDSSSSISEGGDLISSAHCSFPGENIISGDIHMGSPGDIIEHTQGSSNNREGDSTSNLNVISKTTVLSNCDALLNSADKVVSKQFPDKEPSKASDIKMTEVAPVLEETVSPGWLKNAFMGSVNKLSESVRTLVWDEYRMPRNRHKHIADKSAGTRVDVSVGKLNVELIDAYRTDVKDAADGDYFATCAVVDLTGTVVHNDELLEEDTHTVFNSAAPAFNCKFEFSVPHFRCGVRFILIDGGSGRKIGTSYVSIYSLLQRDAERAYERSQSSDRLFPFHMTGNISPPVCDQPTDVSNDEETEDESLPCASSELQRKSGVETFDLRDMSGKNTIGHFSANVTFTENIEDLFWSSSPKLASVSPEESVSVDRLRTHINRFKSLVDLFHAANSEHGRIMGWEEPGYTTFLLFLFLYVTIYVNSEYALSVPLFLIVVLMTKAWHFRKSGGFKKSIIEKDAAIESVPYRPFAYLRTAVCEFKNFDRKEKYRSSYPVPQYAKITYIRPVKRILKSAKTKSGQPSDSAEKSELLIALVPIAQQLNTANRSGTTGSSSTAGGNGISQLLSNLNIMKSDHLKDSLLQNVSDPWRRQKPDLGVDISYLYPILAEDYFEPQCQAYAIPTNTDCDKDLDSSKNNSTRANSDRMEGATAGSKPKFQPWSDVESEIKFTFFGDSPEHSFVDSSLGSICIPLRDILPISDSSHFCSGIQPEVKAWLPIKWNSSFSNHVKACDSQELDDVDVSNTGLQSTGEEEPKEEMTMPPSVLLRLQLDLRELRKQPSVQEVEISRAVQSLLSHDDSKSGGTISTLWNMPENIRYVQNLMGSILNSIESFKNIFNWTVPTKTHLIYWAIVVFWVISVFVPGRYLLLVGGLCDFFYCFIPQPDDYPFDTRLQNLLEAVPNDDDLEQVYEWERKSHLKLEMQKHKTDLKRAKLRLVFECLWDGCARLKENSKGIMLGGSGKNWEDTYVVFQGHRLVWWSSEDEVDEGKAPIGQLLLQGHAGVSHASPVDIKEFGDDGRLLSIFGKDVNGTQRKITLLCVSSSSCQALSAAVNKTLLAEESTA